MRPPFFLLPAALLALARPTLAQTAPADSVRPYRHQLGLTISPEFDNLFTANQVLPLGLLYKQQHRPGRAWRLRLTAHYSRRDTASAGGAFYIQEKGPTARVWEVNAFVGYEWQHSLGRRWQWYYGAEAGLGYRSEHREYTNYYHNPTGFNGGGPYSIVDVGSRNLSCWQIQSRGFAGIRYSLSSRVHLFAETAAGASYQRQKSWGSYTSSIDNPNYDTTKGGVYQDRIINTWHLNYFPVQILGLLISF